MKRGLSAEKAADNRVEFNLTLTDVNEQWTFGVENAAIHYSKGRHVPKADTSINMTRAALNDVMLGTKTLEQQVVVGQAKLEGDPQKLAAFTSWLDTFPFWFNIVTP